MAHRKPEYVDEEHIKCSKCNIAKHIDMFPRSRSKTRDHYYMTYCKLCRTKQLNAARDLRDPWVEKVSRIRLRAREKGHEFDLDIEYLKSLHDKQKGLCFYTDYPMIFQTGVGLSINTLSVDKIVPELGYIRGNVVLCTQRANTIKNNLSFEEMRNWMPTWYQRIQDYLGVI